MGGFEWFLERMFSTCCAKFSYDKPGRDTMAQVPVHAG
jgi:hypothetical protein